MRKVYILVFSFLLLLPLLFIINIKEECIDTQHILKNARLIESYWKLPLYFIENRGQLNREVKFYERSSTHSTYFTDKGIYIVLHGEDTEVLKIRPVGGNPKPKVLAEVKLSGKVNYLKGNNPGEWKRDIPTYAKVRYEGVYKGTDLVFYGNQKSLEYDVVVKPGTDLKVVKFSYEGVKELKVNKRGELVAVLPSGREVVQRRPIVYQKVGGERVKVEGRYIVKREGNIFVYSFKVKDYDPKYTLVIDPMLSYSTYIGGSSTDIAYGVAVDPSGNAYLVGKSFSMDFPTKGSFQGTNKGHYDVFVSKISPDGSDLVYSTYIGGDDKDVGYGIAVDSDGSVYITGETASPFQGDSFPTTPGSFQENKKGSFDAFVAKLNPEGNDLVYSTYLGGDDWDTGYGIAVDSDGNAYITGKTESANFPKEPTQNPIQDQKGNFDDAFVTKINPDGSALVYSTFLGGESTDEGRGIAVDSLGNAYVTGDTSSDDFPKKNPYQGTRAGNDAFITKINPAGNALVYSTFFGGSGVEHGRGIALDQNGNVYVVGNTDSATDFPLQNEQQSVFGGVVDAFVMKLSTDGSALLYSTYIGGNGEEEGNGIALDQSGNVYITGATESTDFPVQDGYQTNNAGGYDAFVAKVDTNGTLVFSTYIGGSGFDFGYGIAVDVLGSVYVVGETQSNDFPTESPYQQSMAGVSDAFLAKFSGPNHVLIVSKAGTGSGTVTSDLPGIDCGSDCEESYPNGTSVLLTATADSDSEFTGWGGDCSSCGTNTTCQIMLNADKSCSARFDSSSGSIPNAECGQITINIQGGLLKEAPFVSKNLPTFPITASAPCGAVNIKATLPGASLTIVLTFPNIPSNAQFYKLVNGTYHDVTSVVQINGNTVSLTIEDNGTYDSDTNTGEITDPLVMLVPQDSPGGGDGGCSTGSPYHILFPFALTIIFFRKVLLKG